MKYSIPQGFTVLRKCCECSKQGIAARNVAILFSLSLLFSGCGELSAAMKNSSLSEKSSGGDVILTDSTSRIIPAGYYDGIKTCSVDSPDLIASNIKSGVTILGILGTYSASGGSVLTSNIHRDSGQPAWNQTKESISDAGQNYTLSTYRAIPDITKDDDGFMSTSVTSVDRTGWGSETCGTSEATIDDRIADCAGHAIIGANATWDGTVKGNAGQSIWKLVTRTAGKHSSGRGREVWRDERTGLLWSSLVSGLSYLDDSGTVPTNDGKDGLNWCKASGSNNIANNPTAQDDPSDYCDSSSYQKTGTGPADKAVSACFEDGENFFTTSDSKIDNDGKAGLGYSTTPKVAWRLPNKYDYMQAEVDGLRFVLPDNMQVQASGFEWSASVYAYDRGTAWRFFPFGEVTALSGPPRAVPIFVRCVGR